MNTTTVKGRIEQNGQKKIAIDFYLDHVEEQMALRPGLSATRCMNEWVKELIEMATELQVCHIDEEPDSVELELVTPETIAVEPEAEYESGEANLAVELEQESEIIADETPDPENLKAMLTDLELEPDTDNLRELVSTTDEVFPVADAETGVELTDAELLEHVKAEMDASDDPDALLAEMAKSL